MMSDLTILEITDNSLISLSDDILPETNKRHYIDDEADRGETSLKKFKDEEEKLTDSEQEVTGQSLSEKVKTLNKSDENTYMLDEIESTVNEKIESSSNDERCSDSSETNDSSDDDDDALMVRAMKATTNSKDNDEPIELDDSDSCDELEHSELKSIANDTIHESNEAADYIHEYSLRKRMLRYNPRFYLSRLLLKKSIRILKKMKSAKLQKAEKMNPIVKHEEQNEELVLMDTEKLQSTNCNSPQQEREDELVLMDIDESKEIQNVSLEKVDEKICEQEPSFLLQESKNDKSANIKETNEPLHNNEENLIEEQREKELYEPSIVIENHSISQDSKNCNSQQQEKKDSNTLLIEISKSTIEEMMNRYVFRSTERDVSIENFSEDLFTCLQQNKQEILKVQQEWNEKLHVKYKIREIIERIRRHRAVVEIEGFGYKPSQDSFNRIVSSKSSTTNSENDHFDKSSRMSSESVSRLIQDVRANVLKREDKQRALDLSNSGDYDESSSFSLSSHLQPNQGRQGQIIDVQSIINDFRQKNPQEVPRRGRRVKNNYTNNSVLSENHHIFSPFNRIEMNSRTNDVSISSKTSSSFPEVSLLPVSNFYKNLSQSAGNSQVGQKSSLLQSILTKSTKNNFQHINSNASTTSTLARLLTAPERDRRSQNLTRSNHMSEPRQSNGEITITPIACTARKHEFSMDDEEVDDDDDSNEAPLVIDEPDVLDSNNRNKSGEMLLCQGCRRNKALFMCAGCSKQWYCSKECQEVAWDNHAESCMV